MDGELVMAIDFWMGEFLDGWMRLNESLCMKVPCECKGYYSSLQNASNVEKIFQ